MQTPIMRYQPSPRPFPEVLPAIEYGPDDTVVRVKWNGDLRFRGQRFKVSSALHRHDVALRPRLHQDGCYDVYFAHHHCATIDLNQVPAPC